MVARCSRNAAAGGDTTVKGLILGSAEVDTNLFESLRLLGTILPGGEGEATDFVSELQLAYSLGRINLAGHGRVGWERGEWTRRYTAILGWRSAGSWGVAGEERVWICEGSGLGAADASIVVSYQQPVKSRGSRENGVPDFFLMLSPKNRIISTILQKKFRLEA